MKVAEIELLLLPGWTQPSPDLWMVRWAERLRSARIVEQADWETPQLVDWVANIKAAVARATRPVVFVAHSCGVIALAHASAELPADKIKGALLVAAPDLDAHNIWPATHGGFRPVPMVSLPFTAMLMVSSDDPYCTPDRAAELAAAWGARVKDVGALGHINTASGHGPWPDGTLALAHFLKTL